MPTEFKIDSLANHPHYLMRLSKWYHQAFSHLNGEMTLEQRRQNLELFIKGEPLPFSFVAFNDQGLLGGLCLVESDIESHRRYTPWLSRIFVHERARGESVATSLINHAQAYIQNLGYQKLYLLTEHHQPFFSNFGFEHVTDANLNGFPVTIMMMSID